MEIEKKRETGTFVSVAFWLCPCTYNNFIKNRGDKIMTLEELYTKVMSDENLKKTFSKAEKDGKLAEFLAEKGCDASKEEAQAFLTSKQSYNRELSDDELANVSGGCSKGTVYYDGRPVLDTEGGDKCKYWRCIKCGCTTENMITCRFCGNTVKCWECKFPRHREAMLLCYNPERYNN